MTVSKKTPSMTVLYRILLVLLLLLVGIFLGGTVYAFFFRGEGRASVPPSSPSAAPANPTGGESIFTGIGRLRLSTADQDEDNPTEAAPVMVIITITFPYMPQDRAFSEELAARVRDFRTLTESYFLSIKTDELRNMREEQVKADLLERFNSVLRLGKIYTLYFGDFMLLD
ncbi:MAG: flagellar basal body protein FliL [Treponema sp.]|jgi:flagellar basal body-associated protein FliL|nr:flagellar basal body protein FliL [Treponema sp.]